MWDTVAVFGALILSLYLGSLSVDAAEINEFQREYGSRRVEHPAREGKAITMYSYWGPY